MGTPTWLDKRNWWVVLVALALVGCMSLLLGFKRSPSRVSAHAETVFGPACGKAEIGGVVDPIEWNNASTQTFQMVRLGSGTLFTATLYVMNSGYYLYMGITINDDEFSTSATWLPKGDGFRIDFDNDNSGSLFAVGDDVIGISAGSPQFGDGFILTEKSAYNDVDYGGSLDGVGAASRVGNLNHFEMRHPLCSGDTKDFCLHSTETVGFRLEYLDAEADGSFGGSLYYPGSSNTSVAQIVIAQCSIPEFLINLPMILR